jgi:hypothetical protein
MPRFSEVESFTLGQYPNGVIMVVHMAESGSTMSQKWILDIELTIGALSIR